MMLPGLPDAAPVSGLIGGVLIGLAAAIMLLGAGRIAGVSGIAASAFGLADSSLPRAGTRLGSGCTSGHGVCGMSRLSQRSMVATATFMITGFATVAVMNALGIEVLP